MWPSQYTNYSVASSSYKNGTGDILREFADTCNEEGIKICYYLNVQDNGYFTMFEKVDGKEYEKRELGMLSEVLEKYGPVDRFWFDGTHNLPKDIDVDQLWNKTYDMIRTKSPNTMISSYRGDVCAATEGSTLYTGDFAPPNTTNSEKCGNHTEDGKYFHPSEMHGAVM